MLYINFKKLNENTRLPEKAHDSDFCYDVWAISEEEIAPNVWKYGLGFALQLDRSKSGIPENGSRYFVDCGFNLRPRSSVWKTGMVLANSVGMIDENYTGEVCAIFYHVIPNMPRYKVGDKVAQLCFTSTIPLDFHKVDELNTTDRGDGGFGSTDVNKCVRL